MARGLIALTAGLFMVVACGIVPGERSAPMVPSEEAALRHLAEAVAIVRSGEASRLCELGSGVCRATLVSSDPATLPRTDPTVIGTRVIEPTVDAGGSGSVGGRVLELCGLDGLGEPYYSEMLVFESGGRLISTVPVYWIGIRIGDAASGSATTGVASPPPCPK